jgi:cytochrome c-type biogenesis protein CcmH/NrfG
MVRVLRRDHDINIFPVGNIAHAAGAVLGALIGAAIALPRLRLTILAVIGLILLFGLWGSTFGRPRVNLSGKEGYEEGKWGYDALMSGHNQQAVRWLQDAVIYQPRLAVYWFDLGIGYERLGNAKAAQNAYQRAVQLEPNNTEYSDAVKALE